MQDLNNYKQLLDKAITTLLQNVNQEVFNSIINLGMSGELQSLDDQFALGDTIKFHYNDFKNLSDQNIQHLLTIFEVIEEKIEVIKTINGMTPI